MSDTVTATMARRIEARANQSRRTEYRAPRHDSTAGSSPSRSFVGILQARSTICAGVSYSAVE